MNRRTSPRDEIRIRKGAVPAGDASTAESSLSFDGVPVTLLLEMATLLPNGKNDCLSRRVSLKPCRAKTTSFVFRKLVPTRSLFRPGFDSGFAGVETE